MPLSPEGPRPRDAEKPPRTEGSQSAPAVPAQTARGGLWF